MTRERIEPSLGDEVSVTPNDAKVQEATMKKLLAIIFGLGILAAATANAQIIPGGIDMQPANSGVAAEVRFFHNGILLPITVGISLFVLALMIWVSLRYNSKANPTPRQFSHNTLLEVAWTGIPIIILLIIALPSFELLYKQDVTPDGKQIVAVGDGQTVDFVFPNDFPESRMIERGRHLQVFLDDGSGARALKHRADYNLEGLGEPEVVVNFAAPPAPGTRVILRGGRSTQNVSDCPFAKRYTDRCDKEIVLAPTMTLKVTGSQWNWNYAYPDFGDFDFFSNMLPKDQTTPELYLREVDNHIVVPVGETVRVTVTARDVIHAWALPAFALKIDAVPGRINEVWFKADREGVYYGQCSEICGIKHAFMPIAVDVVSRPEFEAWVDSQRMLAGLDPMFEINKVKLARAEENAPAIAK